ncbi:hypothetical protein CLV43_108390 [Umezawaea tangerina]|uniref:Uncharacterized protein n=1 Tax=Umezawaea tangerina TaxID=84725 RepID=A0A2T0SZZ5_9PSEU|nr:hypothetical protein CLV43_108390 [Umezawaea tangerina]
MCGKAVDRTAPILPVIPTTPARMTHDYVRHGTTSLFAALDLSSWPRSPSIFHKCNYRITDRMVANQ